MNYVLVGLGAGLLLILTLIFGRKVVLPCAVVLPTFIEAKVRIGGFALHPQTLVIGSAFGVGLFYRLLGRRGIQLHPVRWTYLLGMAWVALTFVDGTRSSGTKNLFALLILLLALELSAMFVFSPEDGEDLLAGFTLGGVLATIYAYYEGATSYNFRYAGSFGNPNALGFFLELSFLAAFGLALSPHRTRRRSLSRFALLILSFGLIKTGCKTAILGLVGGLAYLLLRTPVRVMASVLVALALLLMGSLLEAPSSRLGASFRAVLYTPQVLAVNRVWLARNGFAVSSFESAPFVPEEIMRSYPKSLGARLTIWQQAAIAYSSSPLLGIGLGRSNFAGIPFDSKVFSNCFNMYLLSLVEGGVPGILLHLGFLAVLFRTSMAASLIPRAHRTVRIFQALSLAIAIHCFTEDLYLGVYTSWPIGLVWGSFLGLVLANAEIPKRWRGEPPAPNSAPTGGSNPSSNPGSTPGSSPGGPFRSPLSFSHLSRERSPR